MTLVERILSGPSGYDEIAQILDSFNPNADVEDIHEFGNTMTQIFGTLAKTGRMNSQSGDNAERKTAKWLVEQLEDYQEKCIELLGSPDQSVSQFAFEALMKVVMIRGKYCKINYESLIENILTVQLSGSHNIDDIWLPYLEKYDDVRYQFFRALDPVLKQVGDTTRAKLHLIDIFEAFDAYPEDDEDLGKWMCGTPKVSTTALKQGKGNMLKVSSHKTSAQSAWLAFLNLDLNATEVKRILTVLHINAIPNMAKPQLLMDFLTDSYDFGGPVALLALDSLFLLIQQHNLDYPKFFEKLYKLLGDGSLFASAHRARFLRLLDLFLTSTHLPGTIPASVIKRMARLSLFSPPGAIVAVIPFIYNQLKRHPTCILMIHRNADITGPESDPFNGLESDPQLTGAIDSSLWEMEALTTHYQPNVAALARIFSQPMNKPSYQLEHFLSHSYETLYSSQMKRKGNGGAALEYEDVQVFKDTGYMGSWGV